MKKTPLFIGGFLLLPAVAGASGGPDLAGSLAQMVGSLVLVIGIILILYYLAGRFLKLPQGGTASRYIRVVETRHLGPKKSLVLVEVAGEYLLLSNTGDGVSFIKQVEMVEEIEVVEERRYATLIPAGLRDRLKKINLPSGVAELCLQKKSGGLA